MVRYQAGQEFAAHLDTGPTLPKWVARLRPPLLRQAEVVAMQRAAVGTRITCAGAHGRRQGAGQLCSCVA